MCGSHGLRTALFIHFLACWLNDRNFTSPYAADPHVPDLKVKVVAGRIDLDTALVFQSLSKTSAGGRVARFAAFNG